MDMPYMNWNHKPPSFPHAIGGVMAHGHAVYELES
ncbi:MAG: hypothetical protein ACI9SC_000734 [Gammaproteobacteria bacterium]|jgi:hypothetical protein